MPLVFNGVTIPENVANAFSFNGVDITDVYFNGVQVWHQSLGPTVGWSGDSFYTYSVVQGISVSGFSFRFRIGDGYGAWLTVTSSGLPAGLSVASSGMQTRGIESYSSNLWRHYYTYSQSSTYISYNPSTKVFTGTSLYTLMGFTTSGGLIRAQSDSTVAGAWISLT